MNIPIWLLYLLSCTTSNLCDYTRISIQTGVKDSCIPGDESNSTGAAKWGI